jgi:aldose 1-epimerase
VSGARIQLRADPFTVELAPGLGGSLAAARHGGREVLRPLSSAAEAARDILEVACFPLVPYANRIDRNLFEFEGRIFRFEPNLPPYPFNEHGSGWTSAWQVAEASASRAVLQLERLDSREPYSFCATQEFSLQPNRLTIGMSVTNAGTVTMPFGFGQHPWFIRDADTTLRFEASHFWLEGPGGSATDRITLPPELSFATERNLPASWRNNCYGGWRGSAVIGYRSRGFAVTIEADPVFRHLMLYADPELEVFCVEPQTNASCAFNKLASHADQDLGVLVLEPGQTARGTISLTVEEL